VSNFVLNGELKARHEGQYVELAECGERLPQVQPQTSRKPVRKDHNAGGGSDWMDGFFEGPSPDLWQASHRPLAESPGGRRIVKATLSAADEAG